MKKRHKALAEAKGVATALSQDVPAAGYYGAKAPAAAPTLAACDAHSALGLRQSTRLSVEAVSEETNHDSEWTSEEEVEGGLVTLLCTASSVSPLPSPAPTALSPAS